MGAPEAITPRLVLRPSPATIPITLRTIIRTIRGTVTTAEHTTPKIEPTDPGKSVGLDPDYLIAAT